MNNKVSKGLEFLLIPVFALMTVSCKDATMRSTLIKTDTNHRYIVSVDTNNLIRARRDGNIKNAAQCYELIDSLGDAQNVIVRKLVIDKVIEDTWYKIILTGPADSSDRIEYAKIYPSAKLMLYKKD